MRMLPPTVTFCNSAAAGKAVAATTAASAHVVMRPRMSPFLLCTCEVTWACELPLLLAEPLYAKALAEPQPFGESMHPSFLPPGSVPVRPESSRKRDGQASRPSAVWSHARATREIPPIPRLGGAGRSADGTGS